MRTPRRDPTAKPRRNATTIAICVFVVVEAAVIAFALWTTRHR